MSVKRLKDLFYEWQHDGRAALRLNYTASAHPKVSRELLQKFFAICNQPGTRTLRAAYLKLAREWSGPLPVTYSAICRHLGRATLDELQTMVLAKARAEARVLRLFLAPKESAA